jgi:hypothetical protein
MHMQNLLLCVVFSEIVIYVHLCLGEYSSCLE